MEWMNLTAPDFAKAVEDSGGVCVLPIASIEKHGEHLPLGCDTFNCELKVRRACEKANVMMFPVIPFAENSEAMNHPGAVALRRPVLFDFVWNLIDEIVRNGFRKVILVSGHGGNWFFAGYLLQDFLMRETAPKFMLYFCTLEWDMKVVAEVLETECTHGGEGETSCCLVSVPDLVKMGNIPQKVYKPLGRVQHLRDAGIKPAIWWSADHPEHYNGDARPSTAEKGEKLFEDWVNRLAAAFKAVREDEKAFEVYREYIERRNRGGLRT
ncbi:MAG: hypothetical protein AMS16_04750 [Planctomycetes bacterium DG_58]|nr:MAG: hypothetical protein AMS16_04750 [Planctomycetes bacterium DG_58]